MLSLMLADIASRQPVEPAVAALSYRAMADEIRRAA
jgi:hypothetical protein